jgi:hypothetical protein
MKTRIIIVIISVIAAASLFAGGAFAASFITEAAAGAKGVVPQSLPKPATQENATPPQASATSQNLGAQSQQGLNAQNQNTTVIGEEGAKEIALGHAGFSESEVERLTVRYDIDDGRAEYDIEFHVGRIEYSYEINAANGNILSYEADQDD